ncbi:unnamed protein product [Psylliodes chrysocephalus]|uniref:Uncharacterized protein n=1 Tax=Psylliodes chrysocephalus TaxID=3402493 RepID=A0A9P0D475_9CUCU|nr:unnamed protein product [Psylliodes chrysocephala]
MYSKRQLRSTKPSGPGEWLIGEYHKQLITTRIPSRWEVLSFFLFHHYENKLTIAEALKLTTQQIQQCWDPKVIIKDFHIKEKIKKIFDTWQKLKKNRLRLTNVQRENENAFLKSLDDMFECKLQTKVNNLTTESVTHSKKALSSSNSEPPVLLSQKKTHPATWNSNQSYLRSLNIVRELHIVNDTAERGVSLMQEYLEFVKNEDELQRVLQVVEENRYIPMQVK